MLGRKGSWVLAVLSLVAAPLGAYFLVESGAIPWTAVLAALACLLVGTYIVASGTSGNLLTLGVAVAAAIPFVFTVNDRVDLPPVIATYLLAYVALTLRVFRHRGTLRAVGFGARRLIGSSCFAVVFAFVRDEVGAALGDSGWEVLLPFLAAGVVWFTVETGLWAVFASDYRGVSVRYLALASLKDANVFATLVATGGLFGLMYESLGWWAVPVTLLPYSFAHGAFARFQETRSTYKQTIRALARIPEVSGLNIDGHSDRTSDLAVAIAKDLGLSPDEVDDVHVAALMHDIGHITLNEPTVVEKGWTHDDLARWGAEILAGSPTLERVSGYVRRQYEPYRRPGDDKDPDVALPARIVKVASSYDARTVGEGMSRLEALEVLHQGAAYEYDPDVVAALRRVLDLSDQDSVSV